MRTRKTSNVVPDPTREEPEPLYVLWGRPCGSTDALDEKVLLSEATQAQCDRVRPIAAKDGWYTFRQVALDNKVPDFAACLRKW